MDEKTLHTLEFPKILERLSRHAAFSASAELALALRPSTELTEAQARQSLTSEARRLLDTHADVGVGGATDVRPQADLAAHGGVLEPANLLAVRYTLISARQVVRTCDRKEAEFPQLAGLIAQMPPPFGLIDAISHAISERGDILDSASPQLNSIRSELKVSHERLLSKLQRLIADPKSAQMLQEGIITQRDGRYVIPLRAEFKGKIRSIIHDQSASGATLFIEPLVVVELNNRYRELQLAERDEERRILSDLSRQVGMRAGDVVQVVEILAAFDLALMCAKYAEDLHAVEPVLVAFQKKDGTHHPGSTIRLFQARHPLLDPATVVPVDVDLDERTYALVITGPNTGGKTVSLKTVGLLALMGQSGLHIPAQSGSEISIFESIYADIGDEQSIEQSLSTFSAHITHIIRILDQADAHSLVLLDELGAGTDPQEGSALARSILTHLLERRVTTLVATHYPELKAFAHSTPGVVNASVEFDVSTLRPTYHLTIGLPGRSNALAIADRLGLPHEIIDAARDTLDPNDLRAEDLLNEIHHQRDLSRQARAAAEQARRDAETQRAELYRRLEKIEDERRGILESARKQAEAEAADLQRELEDVRRALARARQPLEALKPIEAQVEEMQETVEKPVERQVRPVPKGPLRLGERVRLRLLNMDGVVTGLSENETEVQVGALRVRARLGDVQRKGEEPAPDAVPMPATAAPHRVEPKKTDVFRESPGMELDLRGQRAEDALPALERHIESAYLAGLPFVRIIHGKGTGRLRQVVREALHESPHVTSYESGRENEGGDGVTVVRLAED
ncbi:MAG: endonuclease MutS2 [Anaerolineaceae bacterium]|nr:endonuclease MutS2 [Anaerolineaceae bacterium]